MGWARCSMPTAAARGARARARGRARGRRLYGSSDKSHPRRHLVTRKPNGIHSFIHCVLGRGIGRTLKAKFEAVADSTRAIPFPDTSMDVDDFKRFVVGCHGLFVGKFN